MAWWIWLLAGFGLLLLELATPGIFFMFFGVAAILVGLLAAAGIGAEWVQFVIFAVLAIGTLLAFRGPLLRRIRQRPESAEVDAIAGETALLTEDLPARGLGKAELRGTVWTAQNASEQALARGQRVRVERVDGLKLLVRPE